MFSPVNYSFQSQAHTSGNFPENLAWYFSDALSADTPTNGRAARYQAPSIRLVAWIPHGDDDLIPELWTYTLSPEENCQCLNLRERMYGLRLDFQMFALLGGRHLFFARDSEDCTTYTTCVEVVFD
ncbi:hypothetical protein HWV62_31750 [Athelia sp. TMB]|nr:hypothetical protein HWV62_31750 [Athelia sp. TMB]